MSDKELIDYILENNNMNTSVRITTILKILANAMIQKGWCTQDECNQAVENGLEKMAEVSLTKLSKEEKELLETQAKLSKDDLFGRFFK